MKLGKPQEFTPEQMDQYIREVLDRAERIIVERKERAEKHRREDLEIKTERMIPEHTRAIRSAAGEILKKTDDSDPVVGFMAVTITASGEIQIFNHGAIEPKTGSHALECLNDYTRQRLRAMTLTNKSPLFTQFPGGGK